MPRIHVRSSKVAVITDMNNSEKHITETTKNLQVVNPLSRAGVSWVGGDGHKHTNEPATCPKEEAGVEPIPLHPPTFKSSSFLSFMQMLPQIALRNMIALLYQVCLLGADSETDAHQKCVVVGVTVYVNLINALSLVSWGWKSWFYVVPLLASMFLFFGSYGFLVWKKRAAPLRWALMAYVLVLPFALMIGSWHTCGSLANFGNFGFILQCVVVSFWKQMGGIPRMHLVWFLIMLVEFVVILVVEARGPLNQVQCKGDSGSSLHLVSIIASRVIVEFVVVAPLAWVLSKGTVLGCWVPIKWILPQKSDPAQVDPSLSATRTPGMDTTEGEFDDSALPRQRLIPRKSVVFSETSAKAHALSGGATCTLPGSTLSQHQQFQEEARTRQKKSTTQRWSIRPQPSAIASHPQTNLSLFRVEKSPIDIHMNRTSEPTIWSRCSSPNLAGSVTEKKKAEGTLPFIVGVSLRTRHEVMKRQLPPLLHGTFHDWCRSRFHVQVVDQSALDLCVRMSCTIDELLQMIRALLASLHGLREDPNAARVDGTKKTDSVVSSTPSVQVRCVVTTSEEATAAAATEALAATLSTEPLSQVTDVPRPRLMDFGYWSQPMSLIECTKLRRLRSTTLPKEMSDTIRAYLLFDASVFPFAASLEPYQLISTTRNAETDCSAQELQRRRRRICRSRNGNSFTDRYSSSSSTSSSSSSSSSDCSSKSVRNESSSSSSTRGVYLHVLQLEDHPVSGCVVTGTGDTVPKYTSPIVTSSSPYGTYQFPHVQSIFAGTTPLRTKNSAFDDTSDVISHGTFSSHSPLSNHHSQESDGEIRALHTNKASRVCSPTKPLSHSKAPQSSSWEEFDLVPTSEAIVIPGDESVLKHSCAVDEVSQKNMLHAHKSRTRSMLQLMEKRTISGLKTFPPSPENIPADVWQVWCQSDIDGNGVLDAEETWNVLNVLGMPLTAERYFEFLQLVDTDGDCLISLDELVFAFDTCLSDYILRKNINKQVEAWRVEGIDPLTEAREVWDVYDTCGVQQLDVESVQRVLTRLKIPCTTHQLSIMLRELDVTENTMQMEDFLTLFGPKIHQEELAAQTRIEAVRRVLLPRSEIYATAEQRLHDRKVHFAEVYTDVMYVLLILIVLYLVGTIPLVNSLYFRKQIRDSFLPRCIVQLILGSVTLFWVGSKFFLPKEVSGHVTSNPAILSVSYIRSFEFVRDSIGVFPTEILALIFREAPYREVFSFNRLLLLVYLNEFYDRLTRNRNPMLARIVQTFMWWIVIIHLFSCAFLWVASIESDENIQDIISIPNFLSEKHSIALIYFQGFNFSMSLMVGLSRGEPIPQSDLLTVLSCIIVLVGVCVFAIIVAKITNALNVRDAKALFDEKMDEVHSFAQYMKLPHDAHSELADFYRHMFHTMSATDLDYNPLKDLPLDLEVHIRCQSAYLLFRDIEVFKPLLDKGVILHELYAIAKPTVVMKGEWLCRQGEPMEAIYIVTAGSLLRYRDGNLLGSSGVGDAVNDYGLIENMMCVYDVCGHPFSLTTVMVLDKQDVVDVLQLFPEIAMDVTHSVGTCIRRLVYEMQAVSNDGDASQQANTTPHSGNVATSWEHTDSEVTGMRPQTSKPSLRRVGTRWASLAALNKKAPQSDWAVMEPSILTGEEAVISNFLQKNKVRGSNETMKVHRGIVKRLTQRARRT